MGISNDLNAVISLLSSQDGRVEITIVPKKESLITALEQKNLQKEMERDPMLRLLQENTDSMNMAKVQQASDPLSIYQSERPLIKREMYLLFTSTSPTARKHLQAFDNYCHGHSILCSFRKSNVEVDGDCDLLNSAFQCYSWGHMVDSALYGQFRPPAHTMSLLNEYLDKRPNDVYAQYFKVCILFHESDPNISKYEAFKVKIVEAELLADRIRHLAEMKAERMVLIDTHYLLSSMYVVTDQEERALDSIKKCYELDTSNIDAMYLLGYLDTDLKAGIAMLHRYLDAAPKCDQKYPNACYQLGINYFSQYQNMDEAIKFYHLGLKAEDHRLPFFDKDGTSIPAKKLLETMSKCMAIKREQIIPSNIYRRN